MPDSLSVSAPVASPVEKADAARCPFRALTTSGVAVALLAGAVVTLFVLAGLGGLHYYVTPLRVRGYDHAHKLLRPSGPVGQTLGMAGSLFIFLTLPYVARKRVKALRKLGSMKAWMEVHVFCGVFGPILVSLHTSLKFNGIVSVAYWSMVLVVLSGFVGRFLYARIPRTIRGEEMTRAEIDARVAELSRAAADRALPPRELKRLEKDRRRLDRRIAALERTKRLFALWHVFHRPLVWILFAIFVVHVAVVSYLGYALFTR